MFRKEEHNSKFIMNSKYLFLWNDREITYFDIEKPFL